MAKTLYIIDGHYQIYRAYYAPFGDLASPAGEPTRATYVFCTMLLKLIADCKPDYLAMAVDGPAEALHRRRVYADYKITRDPTPDDLPPQMERIFQIVEAMGIPILQATGYEADDVIATVAGKFAAGATRVVIVSRDKDLDQLVGEHVVLHDPQKGRTMDAAGILAAKGYPPEKAVEIQTLTGDSIDNIPGIEGVGPKTAARLIAKYGSADQVVAHADELTPKLRERILAGADGLELSRSLVTLERRVPIELDLKAMRFGGVRVEALQPIFAELGFNKLLGRLDNLGGAAAPAQDEMPDAPAGEFTTAAKFDYRCVDTPEGLAKVVDELRGVRRLAVDTETTSTRPRWCELVGISLAWKPGRAVYLPIKGPLGARTLEIETVRELLGPILADERIEKVGQNLKYDWIVLKAAGFALRGKFFDTMVAAHVLDSMRMTYKLDALASEFLNHRMIPIEQLIGRGRSQTTMDTVPVELVATYAAEDADVAGRLGEVLAGRLGREEGLTALFENLEMPLMPVLAEMEWTGIRVDPAALGRMQTAMSTQADALRERIVAMAGCQFNPDSPRQLAGVLFEKLELPVQKRTKTGPSTDSGVLEKLAALHEMPATVLEYRKLTKLLGTYCRALGGFIHPATGRIHTSFHQAGTATGRLSSSAPNLQNIPIRSEQGRQIRSAFVAAPGQVLLSADYSQVELRVLAHLCGDETLTAAFDDDRDIHRIVAAEVFGVRPDDVTAEQRARAKTVNFGIIYGQTAYGLSVTLRISPKVAGEFIKAYRQRFPKIDEFLGACVAQARSVGYVETIFGRRRRIGLIDSDNAQRRAMAERMAINSVVQGSAADLIKQAMINIAARIGRENRPGRMLLQIHDELVFEMPAEAVEDEKQMIVSEMTGAIRLRVPLKVDVGVGANWMEAKAK